MCMRAGSTAQKVFYVFFSFFDTFLYSFHFEMQPVEDHSQSTNKLMTRYHLMNIFLSAVNFLAACHRQHSQFRLNVAPVPITNALSAIYNHQFCAV